MIEEERKRKKKEKKEQTFLETLLLSILEKCAETFVEYAFYCVFGDGTEKEYYDALEQALYDELESDDWNFGG